MRTIWKFNLAATDRQTLPLPLGAKVLAVGAQEPSGGTVQLWAEVDPQQPTLDRHFAIVGTGNPLPEEAEQAEYLGTVITRGGSLVWHVYEVVA